jgi:hypothetical protein
MTSDRFQPSAPEGALQKRDSGLSEKGSQHSALPFNASDSRTVDSQAVISSLALGKTESAQLAEVPETPQLPQARSISRLADQLSGEVVLMQRLRSGVMTAVLKPDAHSELRVDLRRREGRLEIRATMERGDSQAISEGWSELQQQLRAQGVHLLPLERPSSPPSTSRLRKRIMGLPGVEAKQVSRCGLPLPGLPTLQPRSLTTATFSNPGPDP